MKTQEKKVNKAEENGAELTDEELSQVAGGLKLDPERLRKKVEDAYPTQ